MPEPADETPPTGADAIELARRLIAGEAVAAADLVDRCRVRAGSIQRLYGRLFEPAARHLGDLWEADACRAADLTLALCGLQTLAHAVAPPEGGPAGVMAPSVLVVAQPGETDGLCVALHAELLWQAGWDILVPLPLADEALLALVRGTWFDALDLCLSAALPRPDWLPRVARTIARVRRASLNPSLAIVAGGRTFLDDAGAAVRVGADAGCRVASDLAALPAPAAAGCGVGGG